ncbi:uncharacterized protein LOC128997321 [Macrosteles quadrilineatus]|uniref:uncharacterized protein LOC128997321 n=1 Tax=Macrosteles quadrilineatus TaxID=74068 RepID=UPI0023E286AB|nr:uncharacterized protein LOC128997321 [Macrosteles quadrilineatus]
MFTVLVILALSGPTPGCSWTTADPRSPEDHVDPWDVVVDYDPEDSAVAEKADIHLVDKMLRLAQKDTKYFHEARPPWEGQVQDDDPGVHVMGFNFTAWNRTYIRPPPGLGDAQTNKLMSRMIPEFDITKIKLKSDKRDNKSVIFEVLIEKGPENKIIGYTSKQLHVQIFAPVIPGAIDDELERYLSKVLTVSRKSIKIIQGDATNIRKIRIPKIAVQKKVYIRKLIEEFELDEVTRTSFDA